MTDSFIRSDVLLPNASAILKDKCIAIVGLGGVGCAAVEALARTGVGQFVLIDNDVVESSNINRQLAALTSTIGQYKTKVLKDRILDINKDAKVLTYEVFYKDGTELFSGVDYIIDCIDTVTSKLLLIKNATIANIPIISSMGTGNKMDITALRVGDIKDTTVCPLAKVVRKGIKNMGISSLKVVWSVEKPTADVVSSENGRHSPASAMFVPMAAGLMLAQQVIKDIIKLGECNNDQD